MYNLRPRQVINYKEEDIEGIEDVENDDDVYCEVKIKSPKNKNSKTKKSIKTLKQKNSDLKVGMDEYVNQLRYYLILNDELKGQCKVENSMKCMTIEVSLINNYNMPQKFADAVKTKIEEFLKEDAIKDMNRSILEEYLQMF